MTVRGFAVLALITGIAGTSAGCKAPEPKPQVAEAPRDPPRPAPPPRPPPVVEPKKAEPIAARRTTIDSTREGRPIECLEFGQGEDVVLIMASIHGNEGAGTPLVRRLADQISRQPEYVQNRKLVLLPVANPDGLARGSRGNARGVDLNRNFPAGNYKSAGSHGSSALSEPESKAIQQVLKTYKPRRIISLHQPANTGPACIDFDGPADALARAMASQCDLPIKRLGAKSGSLGSYAGLVLGIPIVTVELPKSVSTANADALWGRYGRMLLAALRYPEAVSANAPATGHATTVRP